jgi:hypothetical protein
VKMPKAFSLTHSLTHSLTKLSAIFAAFALVFALAACPTDGGGNDDPISITVANTAQWNNAMNQIKNGGNGKTYILTIADDFDVSPTGAEYPTFGSVTGLTVTLEGDGELTLAAGSGTGALFFLQGSSPSARQKLIIDGPTLWGKAANNNPVVVAYSDAALEMKNGIITGNTNSNPSGGVFVGTGCSFTMSGGEISGNTTTATNGGGGVMVSGSFTMSGGTISNNTASATNSGGGGVSVISGSFTMSGGEISGNTAATSGGVLVVGNFTMTGGEISGNTAQGGGGGGVSVSGSFTMSGGKISGNTTTNGGYGGGVFVDDQSSFSKSGGGTINGDTDNTNSPPENTAGAASGNGHAVYYNKDSGYYRDTTLTASDDISTATLPTGGSGSTGGGWTKG